MKKIILLVFAALIMFGCTHKPKEQNQVCGFDIIVVDSCEYLEKTKGNGGYAGFGYLAHKGNCRFCKERDSIKWEKRKKELIEQLKRSNYDTYN